MQCKLCTLGMQRAREDAEAMLQRCNRVLDVYCFRMELADKQCAGVRRRFSPIAPDWLFHCQATVSHVQKENCKALGNAAYY